MVERNQLAPSAARLALRSVTIGASVAEIHLECCHTAASSASMRSPILLGIVVVQLIVSSSAVADKIVLKKGLIVYGFCRFVVLSPNIVIFSHSCGGLA